VQTTQGGFRFLNNAFTWTPTGSTSSIPVELHQQGRLNALGAELNAPYNHRVGVRSDVVWKSMGLSAVDVTKPTVPVTLGSLDLKGWAMYAEGFYWLLGDDTIVGPLQGIQPLRRLKKFVVTPPRRGIMLAFRFGYLNEDITQAAALAALSMPDPMVGTTKVWVEELGINYWISKRFRATFNYVVNHFGGNTSFVNGLNNTYENEFLFRLGIEL